MKKRYLASVCAVGLLMGSQSALACANQDAFAYVVCNPVLSKFHVYKLCTEVKHKQFMSRVDTNLRNAINGSVMDKDKPGYSGPNCTGLKWLMGDLSVNKSEGMHYVPKAFKKGEMIKREYIKPDVIAVFTKP